MSEEIRMLSREEDARIPYWSLVWEQFRKKRLAMAGLFSVFALILIAVYAPFLAFEKPIWVTIEGKTSYPLFRTLFDINYFENGVDTFFNLQIFLLPFLLGYLLLRSQFSRQNFFEYLPKTILIYGLLSLILFGLARIYPLNEKYVDWQNKIETASRTGQDVSSAFPFRAVSFRPQTMQEGGNLKAPNWEANLLGTDKEGRDVFARMLFGTRISLTIGLLAVSIYILIGVILGACAGFFGGKCDLVVSRLIEIMLCFPTFFLILTLSALIDNKTIFHVMLIIGITAWPDVARLVRAEFMKLKNLDYVQAAIALGFNKRRIIFMHVLPNALGPVIVTAIFGVASSILIESSLSFLGLGDMTAPSWGEILSQGRQEFKLWLILAPGMAIFFLVSVLNLVGEGLQDAMDPKLRR